MVVIGEAATAAQWPSEDMEALNACPVCGARQRKLLHDGLDDRVFACAPGQWQLHICAGCGCAYLDPRPSAGSIARAYHGYFTHEFAGQKPAPNTNLLQRLRRALANGYRNHKYGTRFYPSSRLGAVMPWLLPHQCASVDYWMRHLPKQPPDCRLLDLGFGGGAFLSLIQDSGWRICGADPDPVVVEAAQAHGLEARLGGVEAYGDQPGSFDVIMLSHVIEHLHDPCATLRAIRALLKPCGLLWLDTPNLDGPGHRIFGRDWLGLDSPRHLVLFRRSGLHALLATQGFTDIVDLPDMNVLPGWYRSSLAIAHGTRDPLHPGADPLPQAEATRLAALMHAARHDPDQRDNIALIARNPG